MNEYVIGVDAGGTKVLVQCYSLDGDLLLEKIKPSSNLSVNFNTGTKNIIEAVTEVIAEMNNNPLSICIGCAGIETGDLKPRFKDCCEEVFKDIKLIITNDAMIGLYSALEGENGMLIIGGTGSIGYLKQDSSLHRFGGWGHLINDDGSGYSIASKAIRYICYGFDTNLSETPLKQAIFDYLKITKLQDLIQFVYKSDKATIASLARVVEEVALTGDLQAKKILEWAGERLAYIAISLYKTYSLKSTKIALSGGILTKCSFVKESFISTLEKNIADFEIIISEFSPAKGGYYLYKKEG